ncbi:unnamed protein product [Orchesella dallaii]|uniref:MADF domain-containing protein n=1 Tax=Orchesella dallaii TaxID=48710 RepID=A0ABP1RRJ9_9HEXA
MNVGGRSRRKRFSGLNNLGRNAGMKAEADDISNHHEVDDIMRPVSEDAYRSRIVWNLGMKRKLLESVQLQPPIWNPDNKKLGRKLTLLDQCWRAVAQSFGEGVTDASSCRDAFKLIKSSINYRIKKARSTMNDNFRWSFTDNSMRRETLEKIYSEYTFELWRDAEFLTTSQIDNIYKSEPISMNGNVQLFSSTDPLYHELGSSYNNNGQQQMPSQLQTSFFQATSSGPKISSFRSLAVPTECPQPSYTPQPVTVSSLYNRHRDQMREPAPPSAFVRYCGDPFQQPPPLSVPSFTSGMSQYGYNLFPGQSSFSLMPNFPPQQQTQQQEPETVLLDSDSIKSEDNNRVPVRQPVGTSTHTVETQTESGTPSENGNAHANTNEDNQEERELGMESYEQTLLKQIKQEAESTQAPVGVEESFTTTRMQNMNVAASSNPAGTSEIGGRMNPQMFGPTATMIPPTLSTWNGQSSGGPAQSHEYMSPALVAALAYEEELERQKVHQEFRAFVQNAVEHAQPYVLARLYVQFMDLTRELQQSPFRVPPSAFGGSGNFTHGHGHHHASNNGSFSRFDPPHPQN